MQRIFLWINGDPFFWWLEHKLFLKPWSFFISKSPVSSNVTLLDTQFPFILHCSHGLYPVCSTMHFKATLTGASHEKKRNSTWKVFSLYLKPSFLNSTKSKRNSYESHQLGQAFDFHKEMHDLIDWYLLK